MFIGKYNRSVILTYAGVGIAFLGVALVLAGQIAPAMICLILAGVCDLFDGVIARRCKRDEVAKEFGIQIDSLADVMDFLTLPSVLGLYLTGGMGVFRYPVFLFYILCGIIRLAWFNTSAATEGVRSHYDGLPVTYAALILPILWVLLKYAGGFPSATVVSGIWAAAYILMGFLFILNVRVPKPRGIWYGVLGILAAGVTVLILL